MKIPSATLRQLRRNQTLTQHQLADRMGVSQQMISKIEKDPSSCELSTIARYIDSLGGGLEVVIQVPGSPPTKIRFERPVG